jgi:hypothetical protein
MSIPAYRSFQRDAVLESVKALPAAGSSVNTDSFDLGHQPPNGTPPDDLAVIVELPDLAAHSNTAKNITVTLYDSADNSSFTVLNPAVTLTVPGIGTTGTSAEKWLLPIPANCRRYIRANVALTASGPDLTASNVTVGIASNGC